MKEQLRTIRRLAKPPDFRRPEAILGMEGEDAH